jgi:hypothetical protein
LGFRFWEEFRGRWQYAGALSQGHLIDYLLWEVRQEALPAKIVSLQFKGRGLVSKGEKEKSQ